MDTAARDRLIAEDPASEQILKPILRGRDIARYRANWANLWLIDTHNGYGQIPAVDVNDYPAVKAHLDRFLEPLSRRRDKGATPYNLRNCAYHEKFGTVKLLWRDMSATGCFAYSNDEIYTNDKAFVMTGPHLKYLCAILNSSIASWYVQKTGLTTGMGLTQWKKYVVESIPVPHPGHIEQRFDETVEAAFRGDVEDRVALNVLDRLTFDIYGITKDEAREIFKFTEYSWLD